MSAAELFKVNCVTCRAKLSVRNADLIGQIVACPRCNSMVEIVPPPEPAAPVAPVAPVALATPTNHSRPVETAKQDAPSDQTSVAPEPAASAELMSSSDVATAPELSSVLGESNAAAPGTLVWSVASFVVGATIMSVFLMVRPSDNAAPTPEVAPVQPTGGADGARSPATTIGTVENRQSDSDSEKPAGEAVHSSVAESGPSSAAPAGTGTPDATASMELKDPTEADAALPASEDGSEVRSSVPAHEAIQEFAVPEAAERKLVIEPNRAEHVTRKFDPLSLDPEQMDLSSLSSPESTLAEARDDDGSAPHESSGDIGVESQSRGVPLLSLSADSLGQVIDHPAGKRLDRSFPSIVIEDMPLGDFLNTIASLAGVPVSVAPLELQMAGISPRKRISLNATAVSLESALEQALNPLRLETVPRGQQLIVVRQGANKKRSIEYPVDDLLSDQTKADDFAHWVQQLVVPDSWQGAGGEGTVSPSVGSLRVNQTQRVHYQILFFLERIRLAKHVPLRSRYPERLLTAQPFAHAVKDRLSAPTTFTFSHETALLEVFRHWQEEIGLPIFVDWPGLERESLWPETKVLCAVSNKPWHAALTSVLMKLELAWRPVCGGAIEITSGDLVEQEPQLDFYSLKASDVAEEVNRIEQLAPDAVVIYDHGNELLYVRAPASVHWRLVTAR